MNSQTTDNAAREATAVAQADWQHIAPPAEFAAAGLVRQVDVPQCPVCTHGRFSDYALGFDYEYRSCRNPWRLVQCDDCHHVWLNPRPAIEDLGVIYPTNYYAYHYEGRIHPLAVRGKQLLDWFKLRQVLKFAGPCASYLDIGCGSGRFLRAMERRGLPRSRLHGLELDAQVVRALADQGYDVRCERVEDCQSIADQSIDLATMFHVIEHIDNPRLALAAIHRWMSPHGLLAIETPNVDSLDARLFRRTYWGGYHFPRHWNLFSPATLRRLLEAAGFEVVATRFQTGHSFWMYSLHHALRYGKPRRPKLATWFDPLDSPVPLAAFTAWDKLRASCGLQTSAMLMLARPAGGGSQVLR